MQLEDIGELSEENIIQQTATDALTCKFSATKLGYIQDDFIQYFYKKPYVRKSPIINRGNKIEKNH